MRKPTRTVIAALCLAAVLATPAALAARPFDPIVEDTLLNAGALSVQLLEDLGHGAETAISGLLISLAGDVQGLPESLAITTDALVQDTYELGELAQDTTGAVTGATQLVLADARDADDAHVSNTFASVNLARGFLERTEQRLLDAEAAALLPLPVLVVEANPPLPLLEPISLGAALVDFETDLQDLVLTIGDEPPNADAFLAAVVAYSTSASDYPNQFVPLTQDYAGSVQGATVGLVAETSGDAVETSAAIATTML